MWWWSVCIGGVAVLHHKKVVPILGILRTDAERCLSPPLPFKCVCSLRHIEGTLPETLNKSRSIEGEGVAFNLWCGNGYIYGNSFQSFRKKV